MKKLITEMLLEDYLKHELDDFRSIDRFEDKESRIIVHYQDIYGTTEEITITPLELLSFIYSKLSI